MQIHHSRRRKETRSPVFARRLQIEGNDSDRQKSAVLRTDYGGQHYPFVIAANMDFLLVCTYEQDGENPELVIYKKR